MYEMIRIADTILGYDFPNPADISRGLYACLARICPLTAPGPAGEDDRQYRYICLREAILGRLQASPEEALRGDPGGLVPEDDLCEAVWEIRREVVQWCRCGLFWSEAGVWPYYDPDSRTLSVDGRRAYRWTGHAEGGPQLTILTAFQEEHWSEAIDCPLRPGTSPSNTCRKLNTVVGHVIRFSVAGEKIRWGRPRRK